MKTTRLTTQAAGAGADPSPARSARSSSQSQSVGCIVLLPFYGVATPSSTHALILTQIPVMVPLTGLGELARRSCWTYFERPRAQVPAGPPLIMYNAGLIPSHWAMVRAHARDAGALRQCVCVAPSMLGCTVLLCAFDSVPRGLLMGVLSDVVLPPARCCMTNLFCVSPRSHLVVLDHHRSVLTWGYLATALRFWPNGRNRPLAHTHEHLVLNGRR